MKKIKEKNKDYIIEYYLSDNGLINGLSRLEHYEHETHTLSTNIDNKIIGVVTHIKTKSGDILNKYFLSLKEPDKIISELEYKKELSLFRAIKNSPFFKSYYGKGNCLYSKFKYEDLIVGGGDDYYKCGKSYYIGGSASNGVDHMYIDRVLFLLEYGDFLNNEKLINSFNEKKVGINIETEYIDRENVEDGFEGYVEKTVINKKVKY